MVKICVATPAYGQVFYTPYVKSLFQLVRTLEQRKWASVFYSCSYADVTTSRNYLLTRWFDKSDASHLLFIDADIGFEPQLIVDMIAFDRPVVGVIYPKRQIDLQRVVTMAAKGTPAEEAIAKAHDFIVRPVQGREPRRIGGFMEVAGCGAGILLIKREAVAEMLRKIPDLAKPAQYFRLTNDVDRYICAFDLLTVGNAVLSEDFSFCHRWAAMCGGEMWARFDQSITHIGVHEFKARYAESAKLRASPRLKASVSLKSQEPTAR